MWRPFSQSSTLRRDKAPTVFHYQQGLNNHIKRALGSLINLKQVQIFRLGDVASLALLFSLTLTIAWHHFTTSFVLYSAEKVVKISTEQRGMSINQKFLGPPRCSPVYASPAQNSVISVSLLGLFERRLTSSCCKFLHILRSAVECQSSELLRMQTRPRIAHFLVVRR